MKLKTGLFLLIFLGMMANGVMAQKRNSIWCFGDSSGIDFNNLNNPIPIQSGLDSRGSCTSISDSSGNIVFYAFTRATISGNSGLVFNSQNQQMQNGDNILGQGWYNEVIILRDPSSDSTFYLFSIGVTNSSQKGLFYSKISFDNFNPLGAVTQKNIQLQNFPNTDCLNAIKHGNGRDWWVISRPYGYPPGTPNFEFRQYLITPAGIVDSIIQTIGSGNSTGLGKLTFSPNGNKLVFNNYKGLIEIYDYDRCTGTISNPITIHPENGGAGPSMHFWGCEFSPNGEVLYVTTSDVISYLFQFDLNAPNIWSSIDTLWTTNYPVEAIGGLKRGPNGKIYESGPYTSPFFYNYPYPDSVYNMYNMNLGVINSPDSLGAACDFQPYSFYLGGKRTYWGLPNNPDYDLPALAGSPCDTLVGIGEAPQIQQAAINVFYHTAWEKAFINASNLKGKTGKLLMYDMQGKVIHSEPLRIQNGYYTRDLSMVGKADGVYLVVIETEQERLVKKMVME